MTGQHNIDQRAWELLNGGVDGELSAAEQEELLKLLAESGEAREINKELKSLAKLMAEVPECDPPQYLQESIERQIRLPVEDVGPEKTRGFFGTWLSANWLRTGFALAAGVVLTVGVYEMGSEPITDMDASNLVGTVVKTQVTAQGLLLDRINISNDRLNGQVEVREKDGLFTLNVQLKSEGPTEVVVSFAGRGLDFEGITRRQDRNDTVIVEDGSVNVTSSGDQSYTLNLRRNKDTLEQNLTPLELGFYADKVLVREAELNVSRQ